MRRYAAVAGALLTAISLFFVPSPASASPRGDQQSVQRQLVRVSAALSDSTLVVRRAQQALDQATRLLPPAQARLAAARDAAATSAAQYQGAVAATRAAQQVADQATEGFTGAAGQAATAQDALGHYASATYKAGAPAGLGFLLGSQSLGDLTTALEVVRREANQRNAAVNALSLARLRAAQQRANATYRSAQVKRARDQAVRLLALRRTALAAAATEERRIADLVAARDSTLGVARQAKAAEQAQYASLQAQSAAIARRLRAAASAGAGGPQRPASGRLAWPVRGIITSPFGYRLDPVFGVWRLHAGLDIAAPGGTSIMAAAAGVVVNAGWAGSYGNYTCISHGVTAGRGLATCYAHQSAILVRSGQRVSAGQPIGRVGTTGASTGNHLHFEVRLDGTPVDPLGWL